jgi:hypothetical protein
VNLPEEKVWCPRVSSVSFSAWQASQCLETLHLPNLAELLWSRIVSVFFAAGSLEVVVHLFVVRITKGRRWSGVVVAAIFFVLIPCQRARRVSFELTSLPRAR